MSELREQLRAARAAYQAQGYPGDLAGELLPRRTTGRRWMIVAVGGISGIAAAVVVTLMLVSVFSRPKVEMVDVPPQVEEVETMALVLPGMPQAYEDATEDSGASGNIDNTEFQAFTLPGMPSFPSMDADGSQQGNPATQEAV